MSDTDDDGDRYSRAGQGVYDIGNGTASRPKKVRGRGAGLSLLGTTRPS